MHNLNTSLKLIITLLLVLSAAACDFGGIVPPKSQAFTRLATVEVDTGTTKGELKARYGGEVVTYQPDDGFAVLGFQEGELTTLAALPNQGAVSSPVSAAGSLAWAGGHSAWAGGFHAWAGGHSAWAGGFHAWAGGLPAATVVGSNLHAFDQINLAQGQLRASSLGRGVTVAVIDSGMDVTHPALEDSIDWPLRYDFIDNDLSPRNTWLPDGHNAAAAHAAGVAGLILQVAPNVKIMPLRVLDSNGSGDTDDVVRAIEWAVENGADVINLSLGSNQEDPALKAMLKYAVNRDVFVVSSVGNAGQDSATFPAFLSERYNLGGHHHVGVGSLNSSGERSSFSNFGEGAELFAPGEDLRSLYRSTVGGEHRTAAVTGTSFAAPLVSGTLALALGEGLAPSRDLQHILKDSSRAGVLDIGGYLENLGLEAPQPARTALYLANDAKTLSSADAFLTRRLTQLGFNVTFDDDNEQLDLVVASNTATVLPNYLKEANVPVVTWGADHLVSLGLAKTATQGEKVKALYFEDAESVSGLASGLNAAFSIPLPVIFSEPNSQATVISRSTQAGDPAAFTYERGTLMYSGTAPARRAGLFFRFDATTDARAFTPLSAALFDHLVTWAVMTP